MRHRHLNKSITMPSKIQKSPGFWCTLCGKRFSRKEHLERHIPHHTQWKPWFCDQCHMPFGRQDLLRRHQTIYHSLPDGLDPVPARAGSHKPDVACFNCHKAKCSCDKQKPTCGSCKKKGIECVPRESKRLVKQATQTRLSAAPQPPAPPGQVPLPAQPAADEHNQQQPVMEASLEAMFDADAYQQERRAAEAQQGLQQGTGAQSSFLPEVHLTGNLVPGSGFPMDYFDIPDLSYESLEGYGNPIQAFDPKDANLGSQNDHLFNVLGLGMNSPTESGFEGLDDITDLSGFPAHGEVAVNHNTHHSLADHHGETATHFRLRQNNGSASALHRDHMPQQMVPKTLNAFPQRLGQFQQPVLNTENDLRSSGQHQEAFHHFGQIYNNAPFAPTVHPQIFPQTEPNNNRVSFTPTGAPHREFSLVSSQGLLSPATSIPSPPPSGSYAQFERDKHAATDAEVHTALNKEWNALYAEGPSLQDVMNFVKANKKEMKMSGML